MLNLALARTGLHHAQKINNIAPLRGKGLRDLFCFVSGASLPEGSWPVFHQRTYTSPGRIQKVTVKSTNISLSPQKESPPGRENQK